mgnify:FL=1
MFVRTHPARIGLLVAALLLSACDTTRQSPDISENPCHPENIAQLDKQAKQETASDCIRQSIFKPAR